MLQSRNPLWAASFCLLCLTVPPLSAAQHIGQAAVHARTPYTAADRVNLLSFSKRFLLENSTISSVVTTAPQSTASNPASKPTILQAADVTFRLVGTGAQPFDNASAQAFQRALHAVFSNFSSAAFMFQSAQVTNLALLCAPCVTAIKCIAPIQTQRQNNNHRTTHSDASLSHTLVCEHKSFSLRFWGVEARLVILEHESIG